MTIKGPCVHCGTDPRDNHSLRLSGICDGIRAGKVKVVNTKPLTVADKDGMITVYDPERNTRKYDRTKDDN